ncbi:hypothetical protein WA1_16580 [Scytonema hofmannii PCC 7110]|uniref:Uncharacterized protein n=1 Tax=Scytonema hofmannii PCC 7110 TaxID=128403 RepID=A0A139XAE9_9CYAN|nr:hypothetical protein [Scytonema hofmannii]KYC41659.1 hypothetical protein WA1_16580 [Scytonema hofmannii PCC 7110]
MSGCITYQIKRLDKFESSFDKLVKAHYRKNKRARSSFENLIDYFIDELRKNPSFELSDDENFPKGCNKIDFQFRKIRFNMPELQGAARYGRLMYIVHEPQHTVYLLWVYTHEEFRKRPGDDELRREFNSIQQRAQQEPTELTDDFE